MLFTSHALALGAKCKWITAGVLKLIWTMTNEFKDFLDLHIEKEDKCAHQPTSATKLEKVGLLNREIA